MKLKPPSLPVGYSFDVWDRIILGGACFLLIMEAQSRPFTIHNFIIVSFWWLMWVKQAFLILLAIWTEWKARR